MVIYVQFSVLNIITITTHKFCCWVLATLFLCHFNCNKGKTIILSSVIAFFYNSKGYIVLFELIFAASDSNVLSEALKNACKTFELLKFCFRAF